MNEREKELQIAALKIYFGIENDKTDDVLGKIAEAILEEGKSLNLPKTPTRYDVPQPERNKDHGPQNPEEL